MANNLTKNPIIIDTTTGATILKNLQIDGIRWIGGTTAGHRATITDPAGMTIFDSVATAANYTDESIIPQYWRGGFIVTVLGSGILYIYLRDRF